MAAEALRGGRLSPSLGSEIKRQSDGGDQTENLALIAKLPSARESLMGVLYSEKILFPS